MSRYFMTYRDEDTCSKAVKAYYDASMLIDRCSATSVIVESGRIPLDIAVGPRVNGKPVEIVRV